MKVHGAFGLVTATIPFDTQWRPRENCATRLHGKREAHSFLILDPDWQMQKVPPLSKDNSTTDCPNSCSPNNVYNETISSPR